MKCFEIYLLKHYKFLKILLTVNMKCFEIMTEEQVKEAYQN